MELTLIRKHFSSDCTVGDLLIDNTFSCYVLEDFDRGLTTQMPIDEINKIKVHGGTAIPTGRYEVIMSYSNRFKKYLPLLLSVPGFEGIRIHPGNTKEDTDGCLLPGTAFTDNSVANSRAAYSEIYAHMKAVMRNEKIFITIKSEKAL